MREETIINKIFTFDELSEEAKEKAINDFAESNMDYDWWEWILEDLVEQCGKFGVHFSTEDVHFDLNRGGYCYVYSNKITFDWISDVDLLAKLGAYQNYMGGGMNGRIQTEMVDESRIIERAPYERVNTIIDKLNKCYDIFSDTLERLWKEYGEIQSEKYIIEQIEANDYEFYEDGRMI